jgi:hypothetical protein
MPVQDNEMKGGIFSGKVISVDHGKIYCRANKREKGRATADPAWFVLGVK